MLKNRILIIFALLLLISSCAPEIDPVTSTALQSQEMIGDVAKGEQLYNSTCSACHGLQAHGVPGLGKDLVNSTFVDSLDHDALLDFIISGRRVWDVANTTGIEMPGRGGNPALTDEQISYIISYLRFLKSSVGN